MMIGLWWVGVVGLWLAEGGGWQKRLLAGYFGTPAGASEQSARRRASGVASTESQPATGLFPPMERCWRSTRTLKVGKIIPGIVDQCSESLTLCFPGVPGTRKVPYCVLAVCTTPGVHNPGKYA